MVGALLVILEAQGRINLDSPMCKYLPELDFQKQIDTRTISIRHLLSHTHGIANDLVTWKTAYLGYRGGNTALIKDFNQYSVFDSTRQFRYSNIGPIIAAMIIEKIMANSWRNIIRENLFLPLNMKQTSATIDVFDRDKLLPTTHINSNDGKPVRAFQKTNATLHAPEVSYRRLMTWQNG